MKHCHGCGLTKSLECFPKNKTTISGYGSQCSECANARTRAWVAKNRESLNARRKEEYAAKADYFRARSKEWHHKNKERAHATSAAYRAKNKERVKAEKRRYSTGFTKELFDKALLLQGGVCAICQTDLSALPPKQIHADHCHATKTPRGVLCHHCNVALGYLKDSESLLRAAIAYLKQPTLGD